MKDKKSIVKNLPPLNLYLDDISSLLQILKGISKNNVEIETEDYDIKNVKELAELYENKHIQRLSLRTYHPYLSINFSKFASRLYISPGNAENTGVILKIEEFLLERVSKFRKYAKYAFWALNITMWTLIVLSNTLQVDNLYRLYLAESAIVASALCVLIVFIPNNRIVAKYKSQVKFWQKNSDKVIVGLITALAVEIAKMFVSRLIR